jgi:hypothetical protein
MQEGKLQGVSTTGAPLQRRRCVNSESTFKPTEMKMSLAATATNTARARPRLPDIRKVVEDLKRRHRSEGALVIALSDQIEENRDLLTAASQFIVRTVIADAQGRDRKRAAQQDPKAREHRRVEAKKVAQTVAKKILLDWMTPLGKALRFCTGAEVATLGSGFRKLAEKVPVDTMVGEVLTEAEVQAAICVPEAAAA